MTKKNQIARLSQHFKNGAVASQPVHLQNDLQAASIRQYPAIQKVIQLFDDLGVKTQLVSGSGPTVFSVFSSRRQALQIARELRGKSRLHKHIFISHTL